MRQLKAIDPREVADAAASVLARMVAERPELSLGLPTGRTAIPFYDELARRHAAEEIDLSRARAFNIDELVLPADHPASFRAFMERHAWGRTGLDPSRCAIPDGAAADPLAECRRYDAILDEAGPLELVYLGVGADGHVAYNLPGPMHESTHVVDLPEAVAVTLGVPVERRPLRAITVGFGPLRAAEHLVLMATGQDKAPAVRAILEGPEDPRWPCTFLRRHPSFDLIADPNAMASTEPAIESASGEQDTGPGGHR